MKLFKLVWSYLFGVKTVSQDASSRRGVMVIRILGPNVTFTIFLNLTERVVDDNSLVHQGMTEEGELQKLEWLSLNELAQDERFPLYKVKHSLFHQGASSETLDYVNDLFATAGKN